MAAHLAPDGADGASERDVLARVLAEVGESFLNYRVVATREAEQRAELARVPEVVAAVPYLDTDVADLSGLVAMGRAVWG